MGYLADEANGGVGNLDKFSLDLMLDQAGIELDSRLRILDDLVA